MGGTRVPVFVKVAVGNIPVGLLVAVGVTVLVAGETEKTDPVMGVPLKDKGCPLPSTPDKSPPLGMETWKVPEAELEKLITIR